MSSSDDLSQALHVVFGRTAAESLRKALHFGRDQILANEDPLSYGPAIFTKELGAWRSIRESFLKSLQCDGQEFSFAEYAKDGLLMNADRLSEEKPIVVWAGCGLPDQLLLAWVVFLFDRLSLDPSKLLLVQYERLSSGWQVMGLGELRPDDIRQFHPEARLPEKAELEELRRAWTVYTSSEPVPLRDYVAGQSTIPLLHRAMARLVYRYPDLRSGLASQDEGLLRYAVEAGPQVVKVIGFAMANYGETLDLLGDAYLFRRLLALGSAELAMPLVSISGDTRRMRACDVTLTPFGKKVLAGKANHVKENGIDDWVGGVHLNSRDAVTFRDGDTLILPP